MKLLIKSLNGTCFDVEVKGEDTVFDLKKQIETVKGIDVYPSSQQTLINQGKILHDDSTTLEDNQITENSLVVIMVNKNSKKPSGRAAASGDGGSSSTSIRAPTKMSKNLEGTIHQLFDMEGGIWDRNTVVCALHATSNNPERAVEYLYSGIPEPEHQQVEGPPPVIRVSASGAQPQPLQQQTQPPPVPARSNGPNTTPLDLFPRRLPGRSGTGVGGVRRGSHDFSRQFQVLRGMMRTHPELLPLTLEEMGRHNPLLSRVLQEHPDEFQRLLNESVEGQDHRRRSVPPPTIQSHKTSVPVANEDREAIDRLEAMGFDRERVLQVFLACNKNEQVAANYLLDHMDDWDHGVN